MTKTKNRLASNLLYTIGIGTFIVSLACGLGTYPNLGLVLFASAIVPLTIAIIIEPKK